MMTKEQYLTFKSDFKKGTRILSLSRKHRKAYWNDGFATQADQDSAIKKTDEEKQSLKDSITWRTPRKVWDYNKREYVEDGTNPVWLGDCAHHHWAYYIAKHKLDRDSAILYIQSELDRMNRHRDDYWHTADKLYDTVIKEILEHYEKIVCAD